MPKAPVPERPSVPKLRAAAKGCRACDLWRRGTQTVFGEGPSGADVMLVGEQPGNDEDLAGRPFVGPAGRILAQALDGLEKGQEGGIIKPSKDTGAFWEGRFWNLVSASC